MSSKKENRVDLGSRVTSWKYEHADKHTEYWKVIWPQGHTGAELKKLLEKRNYAVGSAANPESLRESLVRARLGQMSYHHCTNEELRQFVRDRCIDTSAVISARNKGTKSELLQLLDKADQEPSFPRFLRLPAELRNRIYAFYFADLANITDNEPLYAPIQPPITLASRVLRAETLQMFYHAFPFEILLLPSRELKLATGRPTFQLRVTRPALAWLTSLDARSLRAIRRWRFDMADEREHRLVQAWRNDPHFVRGAMAWFELEREGRVGEEKWVLYVPAGPLFYWAGNAQRVRDAVARVVRRMNARAPPIGMTVRDVKALRRAMEA